MAKKKKRPIELEALDAVWEVSYLMFGGRPR